MLGHAFFPTKKTNKTKQTKTKLNINRDIKEHNNNTKIYQGHQGQLSQDLGHQGHQGQLLVNYFY